MSFELTADGLSIQTIDEIVDEWSTALRGPQGIHPQLDLSSASPLGRFVGVAAERERVLQVGIRDVNVAFSPASTGSSLANIGLLTGTAKLGATKSVVTASATLTAGTTLPAGSRANVLGNTDAIFETIADATNATGITAVVAVVMQAVTTGAVRAAAGSLTVINTPVSGWSAVTNAFDAELGNEIESDVALRARREEELRAQGSANLQAIEADVREITGVLQVKGFENTSDVTDLNGLAGHSIEIVVWDGVSPLASNAAIAQAIFDAACAGIGAQQSGLGTAATGNAIDDEGDTHAVLFTRALQKTLYVTYALTVDSSYPSDGDAQVKAAAVTALNALLGVDDDVVATKLFAPAYSIAGVIDVISVHLGFSASPSGTGNLTVGSREIAIADTGRIVVSS